MQGKKNIRDVFSFFMILFVIPLTLYFGSKYFSDRKYYFISLLLVFYSIVIFLAIFEKREPMAREMIIISVMTALAAMSRVALYFVPHVKPIIAIIIITGAGFGMQAGFMTGAMSAFLSNFFFGQGPWTPYQMFTYGLMGFLSGILFSKNIVKKGKIQLSVFGFFAIILIFGPILNISSAITSQGYLNLSILKAYLLSGLPIDLINAVSTSVFLYFFTEPMIEKIQRVREKYGLYNN